MKDMGNELVINHPLEFLIDFQDFLVCNCKKSLLDNEQDNNALVAMEDILRILKHLKDMGVKTVGIDNNVN